MRSIAFVVVPFVVACSSPMMPHGNTVGSDPGSDGGGGDDDTTMPPDGGGTTTPPPDAGGLSPPAHGFQLVTPKIPIQPHQQISYCYYFQTPNTANLRVGKWESWTPNVHDTVLYMTHNKAGEPGALTHDDSCGTAVDGGGPVWTYAAQDPGQDYNAIAMPSDDGTGKPIGQLVKPGQFGFILMHFNNASDQVVEGYVELNANAYDDAAAVTLAAPYVTYAVGFRIPPGGTSVPSTFSTAPITCTIPPAPDQSTPKFFAITTHTFQQGIRATVKDGATTVFQSTNWERPGSRSMAPFYTFASGGLTFQCDYVNPHLYSIPTGIDPATDEQCITIGYFFPAPTDGFGHFCTTNGFPAY